MALRTRVGLWGALALGVGFCAGMIVGSWVSMEPVPVPGRPDCAPGRPGPPPGLDPAQANPWTHAVAHPRPAAGCLDDLQVARQKIEVLEARLALAATLERGYQGQLFGTPQTWSADTPDHLRPAGFQDLLSRSLDECRVPADLVDFDCAEPPCIASLRPQRRDWIWRLIRDCPEWGAHFTRVPLWTDFEVDCGNGRHEQAVLLSPFWGDYPGDRDDYDKRLASRWQEIRSQWRCAP